MWLAYQSFWKLAPIGNKLIFFLIFIHSDCVMSWIIQDLEAGKGKRFLSYTLRPHLFWGPTSLLFIGYGISLLDFSWGVNFTTNLHLVWRVRMDEVTHFLGVDKDNLHFLYIFLCVQGCFR